MKSQQAGKAIIALTIVFLLYQGVDAVFNRPNAASLVFWDTAGYATALIQHDLPGAFSRDTIWANHRFADSIWASSALYMLSLDFLLRVSKGDIALAFSLYREILLALYIPLAYLLFLRVIKSRWLAFALSMISTHPATFTVTGVAWGIPSNLDANHS